VAEDEIRDGAWPGTAWVSVTRGAHVRTDLVDDLGTRLRAWQLTLPFWSSFTGLTAVLLHGWWVPPLPPGLPLFVASGRSDRIDRRGLVVCRHDVTPRWVLLDGVRVSPPAEVLLACARDLSLLDVVVLGDAALHSGDVTRAELVAVSRLRRRGSPLLRRAIPLMDERAESIYEGLLRVLHQVCGVPVEPQHAVLDSNGVVVAHGDLGIVGTRELREYDGGEHLKRPRQRLDLKRARLITDAGYVRKGYTMEDVLYQGLAILRDADRATGRPHRPARIEAWHDLLRDSLFSGAGRHRLMRRLGILGENAE
jgi:hypothetical protein